MIPIANRYWVGNGGSWNDTAHWASASGTAGGLSVPTSADNTFFDANSFTSAGQTVLVAGPALFVDMNWTGATNSPTFNYQYTCSIYGSVTFIPGMTVTSDGSQFQFGGTGLNTISFGGHYIDDVLFYVSGTWTLQDDVSVGTLNLSAGTLNTNGKTINVSSFNSGYTSARTLQLGASIVNCSGNWNISGDTGLLTLGAGTSTINMTGNNRQFNGAGKTYSTLNLTGTPITIGSSNVFATVNLTANGTTATFSSSNTITNLNVTGNSVSVIGSNTVTNLNLTGNLITLGGNSTITTLGLTANKTYKFSAGSTQTITTWSGNGTLNNLINIESTVAGSPFTISMAGGNIIKDYYHVKDSTATGGAFFIATNSVDVSGNTGWHFGKYMIYSGSFTAGSIITINMEKKTVEMDGVNILNDISGDFFNLQPGENTISYSDNSTAGRTVDIVTTYRDRWI